MRSLIAHEWVFNHTDLGGLDTARIIKEEPNSAQRRVESTFERCPDRTWSQPKLRVKSGGCKINIRAHPAQSVRLFIPETGLAA
jgi:hypothetical protein